MGVLAQRDCAELIRDKTHLRRRGQERVLDCDLTTFRYLSTDLFHHPRPGLRFRLIVVAYKAATVTCHSKQQASRDSDNAVASFFNKAAEKAGQSAAALAVAATLLAGTGVPALAGEADILADPPPTNGYIIDDANVLSRSSAKLINEKLDQINRDTGFRINLVTLRRLTVSSDAFEFADKVLENWYPTIEEGNNKAVVLMVTSANEGAVTGGPAILEKFGESLLDSVVSDNIAIYAEDEKYNQAMLSTVKRLAAKLEGNEDPGAPVRLNEKRESNYKKKEETEEKKGQYSAVVGGLLVISFVVPMLQYLAYVSGGEE
eukprot:jgi/Mesvir1/28104/Mv04688-RA.1